MPTSRRARSRRSSGRPRAARWSTAGRPASPASARRTSARSRRPPEPRGPKPRPGRLPADLDRPALVVAGPALHANHGALVELLEVAGAGVGAGAAQAGHDLVDDVLDAGALGIDVHARRGDALFEQLLAGPLERVLVAGAVLDGAVRGHAEALLVEPAVRVAHRIGRGLVGPGQPRAEHDAGGAGGEGQRDVARVAHPTVGPDVATEAAGLGRALEHRRELRATDAGHHAGRAHGARADADLHDVRPGLHDVGHAGRADDV